RVQKSAEVRSQLGAVLNPFNFPTVEKQLTEAEVVEVENSNEWKQFTAIQTEYNRALKEAEIMFKNASNQQSQANAELTRAQEIRERASSTSNAEERKNLIKQAEILELSAKAKLKESQNIEDAALDLSLNAK